MTDEPTDHLGEIFRAADEDLEVVQHGLEELYLNLTEREDLTMSESKRSTTTESTTSEDVLAEDVPTVTSDKPNVTGKVVEGVATTYIKGRDNLKTNFAKPASTGNRVRDLLVTAGWGALLIGSPILIAYGSWMLAGAFLGAVGAATAGWFIQLLLAVPNFAVFSAIWSKVVGLVRHLLSGGGSTQAAVA